MATTRIEVRSTEARFEALEAANAKLTDDHERLLSMFWLQFAMKQAWLRSSGPLAGSNAACRRCAS